MQSLFDRKEDKDAKISEIVIGHLSRKR